MSFEVIFAIAWATILAAGGGALTKIDEWYYNLKKPSWQPPNWLFGPAWTIILGLAAWAFVIAWRSTDDAGDYGILITLYAVNFVFHFLWSPLFFKARRPDWALVEVPFLWASVLALIIGLAEWSSFAAWLIAPYFLWVTFASALNAKIVTLNRPFGTPHADEREAGT
ncbi:MAG: TspO/MBR family protein [Allopontixanthobacter sediminis]